MMKSQNPEGVSREEIMTSGKRCNWGRRLCGWGGAGAIDSDGEAQEDRIGDGTRLDARPQEEVQLKILWTV